MKYTTRTGKEIINKNSQDEEKIKILDKFISSMNDEEIEKTSDIITKYSQDNFGKYWNSILSLRKARYIVLERLYKEKFDT